MVLDRSRRVAAVAALAAALTGVGVVSEPSAAQVFSSIVNGVQELAEPSTGALLFGDFDSGYLSCSAVLVGCDSAITTAHCFNSGAEQKNYLYFQHAGFREIESATRHFAYAAALAEFPPNVFDILRVEDIAFIKLVEPVSGITPSSLVSLQTPPLGTQGFIVGFGRDPYTATSPQSIDDNAGIKRSGSMETVECPGLLAGFDIICWVPPVPLEPPPAPPAPPGDPGEDVSTCEGDSGGPLFVDEAGARVVAGITKGRVFVSGGQSDVCTPPVNPYDTNVFRHLSWLHGGSGAGGMVSQTGAMSLDIKSCSGLPQFAQDVQSGDLFGNCDGSAWGAWDSVRTCGFTGFLGDTSPLTAAHSFDVPAGTRLMRVAFNGVASTTGSVDTDFYLRASAPPSTSVYDCAADGSGTVGYCEFSDPTADTWHIFVDQVLYQGEYQVTVSLFGPPPPPIPVPALAVSARVLLMTLMVVFSLAAGARRFRSSSPIPLP